MGAMDSAVSDSWDYRDSQCGDAVIVRDADHECGVVAGRERTGGIGAGLRSEEIGDDVVGGGAAGTVVAHIRWIVDGAFSVP